jgi:hypothetical protein
MVRWGSGQPVKPRSAPAPIASAAKTTTLERIGSVRIQATTVQEATRRFTATCGAMQGPALCSRDNSLQESVLEKIRSNMETQVSAPFRHIRARENDRS